ncbi:MAG: hypothetical protein KGD57_03050 [Candidatus Lokiarchaeota archaeon]|nr:hypothetical protein [Candidatus Lokiarchaeota archaeon]
MDFRKKNRYISIIVLSLLVITIISFSSFKIYQNNNLTYNNSLYDTSFPKLSNLEISLLSPDNKTYKKPMEGYYLGTYGFENYTDNTIGLNIDFIDEYDSSNQGTDIRVIEDLLDGHKNYLRISDNYDADNTWAVHNIGNPQSTGTIEFFNRFDNNESGSLLRREKIQFRASDDTIAFQIQINHHNGTLYYNDGISWQQFISLNPNTWYHHRIIFNCESGSNGQFTWIIEYEDGTDLDRIDYIDFENDFTGMFINEIYFETSDNDHGLDSYWDAFGFVWDPNYNIGDNFNKGLLLSFTNSTQINWAGYSLDDQANTTIYGNKVIPMPSNGKHSIQLYCSNGTDYELDKIYFSIDTTASSSNSIDVVIITIVILSVAGITIPSTYIVFNYQKNKNSEKKASQKKDKIKKAYLKRKYLQKYNQLNRIQTPEPKIDPDKLSPIPTEIPTEEGSESLAHNYSEEVIQKFMEEKCQDFVDQCTMHKDSFEGPGYECYECHTKYCVKCAFTLAEKNVGCILCGKPIPILFQKKKQKSDKVEISDDTQMDYSNLSNMFESENILEQFNQSEMKVTFFDKNFYNYVDKLDLDEDEKQIFIKDMLGLTPDERKSFIDKMLKETDLSISQEKEIKSKYNNINRKLQNIFIDEELMEKIGQSEDILLTFFNKKFYKEVEELELDKEEKKIFLEEMQSLTPNERNDLLEKLRKCIR